MKILIAGSDLNAKLLASYLKIEDNSNDIYITCDEVSKEKIYTAVNIKESDILSITDFVKYNQIEFTIVTSQTAIINGIADEFKKEGFPIFAPISEAARVTLFNSIAKKIMYKLKITTPRFGIFDRENLALDYARNIHFPIVVVNDFNLFSRFNIKLENFKSAKNGIKKIFEDGNNKIIIENYIDENPIYMYFVTDGYNAIPLGNVERESEDKYTIAISPSNKIDEKITKNILDNVVYPLLDDIKKYTDMYVGLLGLKIKIKNDKIYVLEFYNGFENIDFQTILPCLNDNLLNIFYEATTAGINNGNDFINISDYFSYSLAISRSDFINPYEEESEEDFIFSMTNDKYVFTSTALTINSAICKMHEYIEPLIKRDTFKLIKEKILQKEHRV